MTLSESIPSQSIFYYLHRFFRNLGETIKDYNFWEGKSQNLYFLIELNLQQQQQQQQQFHHVLIRKRQAGARSGKSKENATRKKFGKNALKLVINAN